MKFLTKIAILFILFSFSNMESQGKFSFPENVSKDKIKFQLINNLILLPVIVNDVELTFLLDTGSNSTIIFSFEEKDSILLHNSSVVSLRGLGKEEAVQAIKSENNKVQIGKAIKENQIIYVVFDGALSFSSRLGVAVHGIIGNDFLRDFVVEINNVTESMRFYLPEIYNKKKCRKCVEKEIFFIRDKPHLSAVMKDNDNIIEVNLLIDSGSGDALWLFEDKHKKIMVPLDAFDDYLGLGINGNIYGRRTKMEALFLDEFHFKNVNTAFPDIEFLSPTLALENRQGTLGGAILKKFNWVIDYQNKNILLKKNRFFKESFHYNMSGLTLEQGGFVMVTERKRNPVFTNKGEEQSVINIDLSSQPIISLKQLFTVVDVRDGSPAQEAGIKVGDEILEINNNPVYRYNLHEINEMFYVNEGKTIRMKIQRKGLAQRVKFDLKDI